MQLYESGENYLETILVLQNRNGSVRSIDIAHELDFTKASVSRAMSILKKAKLIAMDEHGLITLTEDGKTRAHEVYNRHKIISDFLMQVLELDEEIANKDACRMEHIISPETFNKISDLVNKRK